MLFLMMGLEKNFRADFLCVEIQFIGIVGLSHTILYKA